MITRIESADSGTSPIQGEGGGANPTSVLFRKSEWWVADVSLEAGRKLVKKYHYSRGTSNTAVYCHGLYPKDYFWESQCVGVAW